MEALWCVARMVMMVMSYVIVLTLGQKGRLAVTYKEKKQKFSLMHRLANRCLTVFKSLFIFTIHQAAFI